MMLHLLRKLFSHSFGRFRRLAGNQFASGSFLDSDDGLVHASLAEADVDRNRALPFNLPEHLNQIETELNVISLELIGQGAYGAVYSATSTKDQKTQVALKVTSTVYLSPQRRLLWQRASHRELYFLNSLRGHSNIVQFFGHLFLPGDALGSKAHLIIKTERLHLTLAEALESLKGKPMNPHVLRKLANQIGSAITWMHSKAIVHHDLKDKNVMLLLDQFSLETDIETQLSTCTYKLIDFGFTRKYSNPDSLDCSTRSGTRLYLCPEKQRAPVYNPFLADAYAFGVILLQAAMTPEALRMNYISTGSSMAGACDQFVNNLIKKQTSDEEDQQLTLQNFAAMYMLVTVPEGERSSVAQVLPYFND